MDADASSLSCAIGAGMESETLGSDEELNSDNNEFRTSPVHVISHETAIESLRDFIMVCCFQLQRVLSEHAASFELRG